LAILLHTKTRSAWAIITSDLGSPGSTFFFSWVLFGRPWKNLNWDKLQLLACLIRKVSGLANTSILGFPVIGGYIGKRKACPTALLIDQAVGFSIRFVVFYYCSLHLFAIRKAI